MQRPPSPAVAAIVPCRDAQATLAATLESVLAQSSVGEIIVVDDGSSDGSLALARSFEPKVRVLTGPSQGVSAARNRGVAGTTAEWIQFVDADDLLTPGTVAQRLGTALSREADVVICDWEEMDTDGHPLAASCRAVDWLALANDPELATATVVWAPPAAILYRRSLIERIGGFRTDLPVAEDARFLFDAATHGARFVPGRHVGARYRVAADGLSRRDPVLFWQCVLRNGRQIEARWRELGMLGEARQAAVQGIYNHAARGLFKAAHPAYFDAVEAMRRMGLPLPRHSRVATPLARCVGLGAARLLLRAVGQA